MQHLCPIVLKLCGSPRNRFLGPTKNCFHGMVTSFTEGPPSHKMLQIIYKCVGNKLRHSPSSKVVPPRKYANTLRMLASSHQSSHSTCWKSSFPSGIFWVKASGGIASHLDQNRLCRLAIFHPNRGGYVLRYIFGEGAMHLVSHCLYLT